MSNASWIGKSIGDRYEIEAIIGSGGMSTVFKATDPNLKRVVAVKMIHPHMSTDADFVRRFEEEASSVAQLRHPNIVQVHDFNNDGDTYYMVLEFVPGESLADRLRRLEQKGRQMNYSEVVKFSGQICQAVDYAHQRGLIHRDLKPANVMLDVHGDAILMDFGIAKIVGGTRHTATGAVIGTAMYMSPEQIQGVEVDRRTDIYSLGVMLFEMVSGRPPFQADSAMTLMMMHVNDPVPDLRQLKPGLPLGLVRVIEKALAKDRNQRYQTAAEMAEALADALTEPVQGPEPTRAESPTSGIVPPVGEPTINAQPRVGSAADDGTLIAGQSQSKPAQVSETPSPAVKSPASALSPTLIMAGAAGLILLSLIVAGIIFIPRVFAGDDQVTTTLPVAEAEITATLPELYVEERTQAAQNALLESTSTPTMEPTNTATVTPYPTATREPSNTPSPTFPTNYYVRINNIESDGTYYIVQYETFGFVEQLPGTHIHFFYDTVPVKQAGVPGNGPWILYGGPRPFTQYSLSSRPASATEMCARVANADHSLYDEASGNCYPLP